MPVVESIIRFIGLCLFTQGVSEPGIRVLIPSIDRVDTLRNVRIDHTVIPDLSQYQYQPVPLAPVPPPPSQGGTTPTAPAPATKPAATTPSPSTGGLASVRGKARGVESHIAGIAFRRENYNEQASTWKAQKFRDTSLWYVPLTGERVQFITTVANDPASINGLGLPRLQTCCPSMPEPTAQRAQGVIDIPVGALKTCNGRSTDGASRIDTQWTLKHNSSLIIRGKRGTAATKEVHLTGTPMIIVFNLPPLLIDDKYQAPLVTAPDGVPHHHAYYEMSRSTCTAECKGVPPSKDCQACGIKAIDPTGNPGKTTAVDFQCSNSQWP